MSKLFIIPNTRSKSGSMKESGSYFLCPTNCVMTGRYHKGDENGQTQYEYSTLKAVDENGNVVSGVIIVDDIKWDDPVRESAGVNYNAAGNRVIVGRQHEGDENGKTRYATAIVKFNGNPIFVEDIETSNTIKESSGIWFITDYNRVMTGRCHNGDENGNTYYHSGGITTNIDSKEQIKVIVVLHPDEKYYPMNPIQFIKESRFRKHISGGKDYGYNKNTNTFIEGDSHNSEYYDIPVSIINTFHTNDLKKNLRPRDENSVGHDEVFLQPNDHSVGDKNPTGRVAVFAYSSNYVTNGQTRERREFWLFYGYDDVDTGVLQASHQGDWERVTLDIYNNKIVEVWLDQHGITSKYQPNQLDLTESNGVQILRVYSSRGSHATYTRVDSFSRPWGLGLDYTGNGYQWEITKKVENLAEQPWILYAGAWGEVGMTGTSTGPLGPWYKRMDL